MTAPEFQFDNHDLDSFSSVIEEFGTDRFGYVVTPNTDHLIRLTEDEELRRVYAQATYIVLDSRFVALALRVLRGIRLPVCAGSDLTERLLTRGVAAEDRVILIGGTAAQARQISERFGLRKLAHHNPPMGFIHDPLAVDECLQFIESHSPFRFCLVAVGSPQQELIAQRLHQRGHARGLALCVGASIDFLTGVERRAPRWMRWCGLEWLHRLLVNPRRLAYRYLVRGPRIFPLLQRSHVQLRERPENG